MRERPAFPDFLRCVLKSCGVKKRELPIEYAKEMCKKRHKIEKWFSRLKDFGGIATCYDKRARNFLSGGYLAATMTWI